VGDSPVVDASAMTFGGFEVRTPMQTVLPWARPQGGGALEEDGVSPLPAFPLLSPVAEAPPPPAEEATEPVPPRRMPLAMRLLRAGLLLAAAITVGYAASPYVARHVQHRACPAPAVPPLSDAAARETVAVAVTEAGAERSDDPSAASTVAEAPVSESPPPSGLTEVMTEEVREP
jgi:hypothetical protein